MKQYLFCLYALMLFLVCTVDGLAQQYLLDKYSKIYPKEKAIFLLRRQTVSIDFDRKKNKYEVFSNVESQMLHLKAYSQAYADERIPFSDYVQLINEEAYSLVPSANGLKKKQVKIFEVKDVVSEDVFYNDAKEKVFLFPNISKGVQTHLSYTSQILEPRFLSTFFFTSYALAENVELTISVSNDIEIGFKLFGQDTSAISFDKRVSDERTVYTWKLNKASKYKTAKSAPNLRYYEPHLIPFIKYRKVNDGKVELLNSLDNLYDWYYQFVSHIYEEEHVMEEETFSSDQSPLEQAKEIFNWVNSQIQYIAYEDGERGFRPDEPYLIQERRYGDCKDMASLLMTLLRKSGIESYLGWVGSQDLPYKYRDIATPVVDNHMIVIAKVDGQTLFLDATSQQDVFGKPSYFIQGKEVLVGLGEGKYEVLKIPALDKENNIAYDSVRLRIESNMLKATGRLSLEGYPKSMILPYLYAYKNEEKTSLVKRIINPNEPTIVLQDYEIGEAQREKALDIKYNYEIPNHFQSLNNEIYLNLHLNPLWQNTQIDSLRELPVSSSYHFIKTQVYVLELPRGASVKYLPKNQNFDSEHFGYSVEYQRKGNEIILKHTVYSDYLMMPAQEYEKWNTMVDELHQAYRQNIILLR